MSAFHLGSVITASLGHNSIGAHAQDESFRLCAKAANYAVSADLFASASVSAQLGNFQKLFLDLTRFHARVDIPSGSKFINGASKVALALYNSQAPSVEAIQAISPSATLSFQQQVSYPLIIVNCILFQNKLLKESHCLFLKSLRHHHKLASFQMLLFENADWWTFQLEN